MTLDRDISEEEAGTNDYPLCAGALAYMKKACKLPTDKALKNLVSQIQTSQLENILSVPEFHKHHNTEKQ